MKVINAGADIVKSLFDSLPGFSEQEKDTLTQQFDPDALAIRYVSEHKPGHQNNLSTRIGDCLQGLSNQKEFNERSELWKDSIGEAFNKRRGNSQGCLPRLHEELSTEEAICNNIKMGSVARLTFARQQNKNELQRIEIEQLEPILIRREHPSLEEAWKQAWTAQYEEDKLVVETSICDIPDLLIFDLRGSDFDQLSFPQELDSSSMLIEAVGDGWANLNFRRRKDLGQDSICFGQQQLSQEARPLDTYFLHAIVTDEDHEVVTTFILDRERIPDGQEATSGEFVHFANRRRPHEGRRRLKWEDVLRESQVGLRKNKTALMLIYARHREGEAEEVDIAPFSSTENLPLEEPQDDPSEQTKLNTTIQVLSNEKEQQVTSTKAHQPTGVVPFHPMSLTPKAVPSPEVSKDQERKRQLSLKPQGPDKRPKMAVFCPVFTSK